jgi:hypothetical protein
MDKHESNIRHLINEVRDGKLPRRRFISAAWSAWACRRRWPRMLLLHAGVAAMRRPTIPVQADASAAAAARSS